MFIILVVSNHCQTNDWVQVSMDPSQLKPTKICNVHEATRERLCYTKDTMWTCKTWQALNPNARYIDAKNGPPWGVTNETLTSKGVVFCCSSYLNSAAPPPPPPPVFMIAEEQCGNMKPVGMPAYTLDSEGKRTGQFRCELIGHIMY